MKGAVAAGHELTAKAATEILQDAPRAGKPARFTEADRNRVIHLACQRSESGSQFYSQQEIADLCVLAESNRNMVQYPEPGYSQGRSVALERAFDRSADELHQAIQ